MRAAQFIHDGVQINMFLEPNKIPQPISRSVHLKRKVILWVIAIIWLGALVYGWLFWQKLEIYQKIVLSIPVVFFSISFKDLFESYSEYNKNWNVKTENKSTEKDMKD